MSRRYMTQLFPWLAPIRKKQRTLCFYTKMKLDGSRYAAVQASECLPYTLFESSCPMYNADTGFDMIYQENKVHNLKLAAATLDKLLIRPGETFSFWNRVRYADRETPYKDGLTEINGTLTTQYGGGLCQISNLLCWLFLHTPLTITERHGHTKKDFPEPPSDAPMGVDATVSEGWLDFKVRNDTRDTYQLSITFDARNIIGSIYTERDIGKRWTVINQNLTYSREPDGIFEEVDIVQRIACGGSILSEKTAYRNRCRIGYPLPPETELPEKGHRK